MKDASKKNIEALMYKGYRITKARTEVLEALTDVPVTIQTLIERVSVDAVSVYRTIAMLHSEGLVEEINTHGNPTRYALSHGHHHHVVCTSCEKVVHISCGTGGRPKAPRHIPGFSSIDSHELTFYGTCTKCV